ncbi:unnamed protein product [Phyllotreta striolata]|uniref:CHK kinase-like domain-containing protein n=1 Tax=Phyllotreta striolata TaxID=444603 RepID=A0A9N9TUY0_PHYSR|nr:unnamed protein product [Phyllotreta striolata]
MDSRANEIQKWMKEIMASKGISNYKVQLADTTAKGDGYVGDIIFLKVTADGGSDNEKVYDMVIKTAKEDDKLREACPIGDAYLREITVYKEIFPVLEAFQEEYAVKKRFSHYAKVYKSITEDKKETLIMQNMKSLGFELHDRTVPQNTDHLLFVYRTYAKLHGASLALKAKKPEVFRQLSAIMQDAFTAFFTESQLLRSIQLSHVNALKLLRKNGLEHMARKIEQATGSMEEMIKSMSVLNGKDDEKEGVIVHGDCWNSNMMFKYKDGDKSRPIDIIYLDFQLSRVTTPIVDLSYYLYSVADKPDLDRIDYLFEEYHKELTEYLRQYGLNADDFYTLERLKTSWRTYGLFGLGLGTFLTRVQLCKDDEVMDLTGSIADGSMIVDEFPDIEKQEECDRRVLNLHKHFYERFLM